MDRSRGQIASLPALIGRGDWDGVRREAHTIKGSSLNLTGKELGAAAARLELLAKEGDASQAPAALKELVAAFDRFSQAAARFIAAEEADKDT